MVSFCFTYSFAYSVSDILGNREIRKNKDCYAAIMLSVKNDFDAQSIGALAASYQTVSDKNDPILIDSTSAVNYAGKKPGSKPAVCRYDGKCWNFGGKCKRVHKKQKKPVKRPDDRETQAKSESKPRDVSHTQGGAANYDDDECDRVAFELGGAQVFRH